MQKSFFKQVIFQAVFNIVLIVGLGLALNFVLAAWSEPTVAPPSGNVEAPVNVSGTQQNLSAAKTIGGFSLRVDKGFGVGGIFVADNDVQIAGQIKISGGGPGSGKVLTSDANGSASWQTPGGGSLNNVTFYKTPGTYTFSKPADVSRFIVELWGGGGGGGGGYTYSTGDNHIGVGGGGGGYVKVMVDTTTNFTIKVGSGGFSASVCGGGGGDGEASRIGFAGNSQSFAEAKGGKGGSPAPNSGTTAVSGGGYSLLSGEFIHGASGGLGVHKRGGDGAMGGLGGSSLQSGKEPGGGGGGSSFCPTGYNPVPVPGAAGRVNIWW